MAETFGNHYEEVVDKKNEIKDQVDTKINNNNKSESINDKFWPSLKKRLENGISGRNGTVPEELNKWTPAMTVFLKYYCENPNVSTTFTGEALGEHDVNVLLPKLCSKLKDNEIVVFTNISDKHLVQFLQHLAQTTPQPWANPILRFPTIECSKEKDNFAQFSDLLADVAAKWYALDLNYIHGRKIAGKYYDNGKYDEKQVYSTPSTGKKVHYDPYMIKSTDYALWEKVLEKSPNKKIAINGVVGGGTTLLKNELSGDMILLNNEKGVAEFLDKNNTAQLAALNEKQRDHIQRTAISADIASK